MQHERSTRHTRQALPMGRLRRAWLLSSALAETLLFSGGLLGWSSLGPLLAELGVLSDSCEPDPRAAHAWSNYSTAEYPGAGSVGPADSPPSTFCPSQEQSLSLGFSVGSLFLGGTFLPLQLLLGYVQLRSLRQVGGALVAVSLLTLTYSCTNPHTLSLLLPFALVGLGVGGSCVVFTSLMLPFFLGNTDTVYTPLVIACYTASATMFTLIKVIYYSGTPFVPLILGFGALSCLMFLNSFFCWDLEQSGERHKYSVRLRLDCYAAARREPEEADWCQKSLKYKFQKSLRDKERILSSRRNMDFRKPEDGVSSGPPLHRSLLSPLFVLHLVSDALLLTWLHFYISSLSLHLRGVAGDQRTADLFSSLFGALQMLALFTGPLASLLLHRERAIKRAGKAGCAKQGFIRRLSLAFAVRTLAVVGFGISCLVPSLGVQILGFVLHVTVRSSAFLFSSSLFGSMFPASHFGALLGIHIFVSSALTLFQHPLFLLLTSALGGDPFWIHAAFLGLSLISTSVPLSLCIKRGQEPHRPPSHPTAIRRAGSSEQTSV
ncbi:large neutral amino acids transporter small subunit 4-like [Spea bombifrons]|uniref:large neutral amino acids transporter small subunit 4-like n=1 Tax=Spea bombifrons TaxID=233779 RepID=UPI00234BE1E0|nr:large neutral amino acids transporter small subunit 4-like [Spea bombifrons]